MYVSLAEIITLVSVVDKTQHQKATKPFRPTHKRKSITKVTSTFPQLNDCKTIEMTQRPRLNAHNGSNNKQLTQQPQLWGSGQILK